MDASTTYILQRILADVDFLRQQSHIQGQYDLSQLYRYSGQYADLDLDRISVQQSIKRLPSRLNWTHCSKARQIIWPLNSKLLCQALPEQALHPPFQRCPPRLFRGRTPGQNLLLLLRGTRSLLHRRHPSWRPLLPRLNNISLEIRSRPCGPLRLPEELTSYRSKWEISFMSSIGAMQIGGQEL